MTGVPVHVIEELCDLLGCSFHDFCVGNPVRYGFRFEQVEPEDYETISRLNRIVTNLSEMGRLLDENRNGADN